MSVRATVRYEYGDEPAIEVYCETDSDHPQAAYDMVGPTKQLLEEALEIVTADAKEAL